MHIWDTGGSEKFRSMISLYYKDAAAAIICYDVMEEKSFQSVQYWINEMLNNNSNIDGDDNFIMALAGNKSDVDPQFKKINFNVAKETAVKHEMILGETSAKNGDGIQSLFKKVAERIVEKQRAKDNKD